MTDIKVLCHSCHHPIYIDHLAGITNVGGKEAWFCDNICCLLEFDKVINSPIKNAKEKKEKSSQKAG
jgi:hypothetical protein